VSRPVSLRALLLALVGATSSCTNDVTFPSQARATFITILTGDRQVGGVGTPLPDSLAVRITDGTGRPVQDAVVRFVPVGLAADGQLLPDTARTDADGKASTRWVLGARAGPAELEAQVPQGRGDPLLIVFSATALAGPAEIIALARGDGQAAAAGMVLPDSLLVRVTDRFGNPLSGERVGWHTPDGGVLSDTATFTDANGLAGIIWRLGNRAGPQATLASAPSLTGSPLTFTATALPGPAVALLKIFGDGQTAPAGTELTDSIVVRLVDALGNGVPSRSISWVAGIGGGSAAPTTGTTDAVGRAFTRWTLGPSAGSQVMNGVVSGFEPAAFSATAVSEAPVTLEAASATVLVGQVGQPVNPPPAVRVLDRNSNPVPGTTVTFRVRGSGGQVSNRTSQGSMVTVATDGAGIAAVTSWTLGTVAGSDTLEASAVGPSAPLKGSPVLFVALALPGPASRLAFLQQPTATAAGRPISPPVTVAVQDGQGNVVPSYSGTVTLALGSSPVGATLGGTTTAAVMGGIATFAGLVIEQIGGGYTLVANAQPVVSPATSDTFTVTSGTAARLAVVTQPSDSVQSGVRFPRQPVVRLEDGFGNPVSQSGVAVTVAISTGGGTLGGSLTVATAATGMATFTDLSLSGLAGPRTLLFSAPGFLAVSSTPVVLMAAPAATLVLEAGGGQTANVGTAVAVAPVVKVIDQGGNPVAGVAVAFTVTGGGGTITGPNAVTSALGIAQVGSWQLGPTKGDNTLTATAAGLTGSPLAITATGRFAWLELRAGAEFSCGVSTAGTPYCWGRNNRGQLGNGGTTDQTIPVPVAGGLRFQAIGLGEEHGCGLTATGAAYCWGRNANGQLGDGTSADRSTPVPVGGGLSFVSIEGGDTHTCALTAAGAAYCWGQNNRGQLGTGTNSASSTPVAVSGGIRFSAVALGTQFTCGLATTGVVYCWGMGQDGQLGDGTKGNRQTPNPVAGSGWTAVAVGEEFTCALGANGAASCWGRNDRGQLGDGTNGNRNVPGPVSGSLSFTRLDAGGKHACGLTATGASYCWGQNASGELGDGSTTDRPVPTAVQGGILSTGVNVGGQHTLAVTPTGVAYGFGRDANGQLGTGTTGNKLTPVAVTEP
jgi:alpha-tubulin suppressor-like RCC1 family protein